MVVVSGEALMDVFDAGVTPTGQSLDARIGGSPLNVAIGLARLAQPVAFFGGIGWLLDRFLGTGFLVPLGVVGGMALSIYLIWFRYGRTGENPPG